MSWFLIGWLKLNLRKVSIAWFILSKELTLSNLGLKITISIVFPPPSHFYCFPTTNDTLWIIYAVTATTFLLFSLHHHISIVFPPPPHFYCFPSTTTFLLFSHHHHISIVFPPPPHFHSLTCIITLQLSHFKSQASWPTSITQWILFYITKTLMDLKITGKPVKVAHKKNSLENQTYRIRCLFH